MHVSEVGADASALASLLDYKLVENAMYAGTPDVEKLETGGRKTGIRTEPVNEVLPEGTAIGETSGGNPRKSGTSTKPNQVHHFATNKSKKYTSQFESITKKYGLDLDGDWNKELMPHQGRHPYAYHDYVLDNMQKFDRIANGDKTKFLKLFDQMKQKIISNPDMLYKDYWKK